MAKKKKKSRGKMATAVFGSSVLGEVLGHALHRVVDEGFEQYLNKRGKKK